VQSSDCKSISCKQHSGFIINSSTTFRHNSILPRFSVFYGSGNIIGHEANDIVSIAGINLNQTFGLAVDEKGFAFYNVPFDGIVGLCLTNKPNTLSFFKTAMANKVFLNNIFSIYFSDIEDKSNILFGKIDRKNMLSNFTFISVTTEDYWQIEIVDIFINNNSTSYCDQLREQTGRCGVVIDSGTSLYGAPEG
jgi:hypothetical protein